MNELPDIDTISADITEIKNSLTLEKKIAVSILRLDTLFPDVSGNKFFKLYFFLQRAIAQQKNIVTFGGAWSNHLYATAAACRQYGIRCTGIVRGEEPPKLSSTLQFCKKMGMRLEFMNREAYRMKDEEGVKHQLLNTYGDIVRIPEGGFSDEGIRGAALIPRLYANTNFTHICCATGTATTLAGLIKGAQPSQMIIGFSVLKGAAEEDRLTHLFGKGSQKKYYIHHDYHFGGFAKKTSELISFMNIFYEQFAIPTDRVYTAKMMFGVFDLINKNYFPPGSHILCVHTGGLQGNDSLPVDTLNF